MNYFKTLGLNEKSILNLNDILNREQKKIKRSLLSTGSKNLDKILGGGFYPGTLYLIFGANRTGKTQLCHQLCVQAFKQLDKKSDKENSKLTYFLDTENTFRPERINELADAFNCHRSVTLKSIFVSKIMSTSALLFKLNEIENNIEFNKSCLLIIDSINNHFRAEQGNKNQSFSNIKTVFLKILKKLYNFTRNRNIITVVTAQVTPKFIDNAIISETPASNIYLNHFFTEYVYLKYKSKNKCYFHLVNSAFLPERKILYRITSEGINDYTI